MINESEVPKEWRFENGAFIGLFGKLAGAMEYAVEGAVMTVPALIYYL